MSSPVFTIETCSGLNTAGHFLATQKRGSSLSSSAMLCSSACHGFNGCCSASICRLWDNVSPACKRCELAKHLAAVMRLPAVSLSASGQRQRMEIATHQPGEGGSAVCGPECSASGFSFFGERSPAPELISSHPAFPARAPALRSWSALVLRPCSRAQKEKSFPPAGHSPLSLRFPPAGNGLTQGIVDRQHFKNGHAAIKP